MEAMTTTMPELTTVPPGDELIAEAVERLQEYSERPKCSHGKVAAPFIKLLLARLASAAREREAAAKLVEATQAYMSQFGQALEANGIPYGPAQQEADANVRAALAPFKEQR